jgi:hypothetical protein
MRLSKWTEAEKYHRAVLAIEPNHIDAHVSYAVMLAQNVRKLKILLSDNVF